jgi:hypothetical protein
MLAGRAGFHEVGRRADGREPDDVRTGDLLPPEPLAADLGGTGARA